MPITRASLPFVEAAMLLLMIANFIARSTRALMRSSNALNEKQARP
jgi:hypothetical protein